MAELTTIAKNLATIRARIAAAALAAGRDAGSITLIAVSKTHGPKSVAAAINAGQTIFGENRVQEAASKFPLAGTNLRLIGPLQSNKAKDAVRLANFIDTLDRLKLADAIATAADAAGALPGLLVQVNIGDEPQKAGVPLAGAGDFITAMKWRFGAALSGLMCIPPAGQDPSPYFRKLTELADTHELSVRSMGMSGDFETAIAHGATHIRIGAAIFGPRP